MIYYFFLIFCGIFAQTFSEIEKIILKWDPKTCSETCYTKFEKKVQLTSDIAEYKFLKDSNEILIRWKPRKAFNLQSLTQLTQNLGINFQEIIITVRGIVHHDFKNVSIISLGDNSTFNIFSPSPESSDDEKHKIALILSDETKNQLLIAERENKIIKIEGKLIKDEKSSSLNIIAQKIIIPPSLS